MRHSLRSLRVPGMLGAVALAATAASADVVIHFTGMNLVYDGTALYDGGSTAGGSANPADAAPLTTADFFVNGGLVGSLYTDISLDVFIPDIAGIPDAPNTVYNVWTPGNPGFFDLLIGTSPLASEFLLVSTASVSFTYVDVAGIVQFTFTGAVGDGSAQNLPFGLQITDPVTLSFSAQVVPGTLTSSGGFITGFEAFGTGEYRAIPAPATGALLALGAGAGLRRRRR
ncbi:MAG TPA: PEP-CTERM sorting domain-containing protein [Phycisphaerales bacterium]|nr:PEP-CTERM sorting domain-containing protein [Phycisphaerales bacterium]